MEDLSDGLYPEALSGFTGLKAKYPYSKYASLADLRIADTHFERGKFLEAIDAYRAFLKYHPSHPQAVYAMFRIAEAHREQIPSDWWFLPPSAEKDQASTRLAIAAYRDLLARYPNQQETDKGRGKLEACRAKVASHPETEEAPPEVEKCRALIDQQTLVERGALHLDECRRKLADHEIYVARFYFERQRYKAAAARAEGLLADYGGLGLDPQALWLAARARLALQENDVARDKLERLRREFPESNEAGDAAALLGRLGKKVTPPDAPRGN
jgi:outer membrane protein assembly factor BamD